ncbi:anaphase promoting complex subunit 11 [Sporobolomyces koalae]|uniref:anaphase promoting complex subunit 11 n=1 Tax=Sporobolomyces koalae TaxID=500713 RepID=UPI0031732E1C
MRITINHYHAVASWKWNLKPPRQVDDSEQTAADQQQQADNANDDDGDDDDDDDEDVCGICRVAYDGCCPDCKLPGDTCPPIWGECTHVFHMHCLLKWLDTDSSKQQCPMDRRPWVTAGTAISAQGQLPPSHQHPAAAAPTTA